MIRPAIATRELKFAGSWPLETVAALHAAGSGSGLGHRVRRLVGGSSGETLRLTRGGVVGLVFAVCLVAALWQVASVQTVADTSGNGEDGAGAQVKWGEPLLGLRMRLSAPVGDTYRRGVALPLLVEMQNVSDKPISFTELAAYCDLKVHATSGEWLGIARRDIAISPWERSSGSIRPQEVMKWQVRFDRQILNKPAAAGSTVHVRVSVPRQIEEPGKLPRTSYSEPVTLKLIDAPPTMQPIDVKLPGLTAKGVTERWTRNMNLVYRETGGLHGQSRAIHIDGQGRVTMLGCGVAGRTETELGRERLDRLASRLHQKKSGNCPTSIGERRRRPSTRRRFRFD